MTKVKDKPKKTEQNQSLRKPEFYNKWRRFFQYLVTHIGYMVRFKLVYRLKVEGYENLPKDNAYILAANHLSTLDPPLVCGISRKGVAYMAKKELFSNLFLRWWLNWLGAFAVDRGHVSISTIKTVMSIKQTGWVLGIFPQGTRQEPGKITNVTKGFASIARKTKCGIVPIGITGTNEVKRFPFTGKIVVKIGKIIPYSDDIDSMVRQWGESIADLTGFEYVHETNS